MRNDIRLVAEGNIKCEIWTDGVWVEMAGLQQCVEASSDLVKAIRGHKLMVSGPLPLCKQSRRGREISTVGAGARVLEGAQEEHSSPFSWYVWITVHVQRSRT